MNFIAFNELNKRQKPTKLFIHFPYNVVKEMNSYKLKAIFTAIISELFTAGFVRCRQFKYGRQHLLLPGLCGSLLKISLTSAMLNTPWKLISLFRGEQFSPGHSLNEFDIESTGSASFGPRRALTRASIRHFGTFSATSDNCFPINDLFLVLTLSTVIILQRGILYLLPAAKYDLFPIRNSEINWRTWKPTVYIFKKKCCAC